MHEAWNNRNAELTSSERQIVFPNDVAGHKKLSSINQNIYIHIMRKNIELYFIVCKEKLKLCSFL